MNDLILKPNAVSVNLPLYAKKAPQSKKTMPRLSFEIFFFLNNTVKEVPFQMFMTVGE
jgi:hypothetical protein